MVMLCMFQSTIGGDAQLLCIGGTVLPSAGLLLFLSLSPASAYDSIIYQNQYLWHRFISIVVVTFDSCWCF